MWSDRFYEKEEGPTGLQKSQDIKVETSDIPVRFIGRHDEKDAAVLEYEWNVGEMKKAFEVRVLDKGVAMIGGKGRKAHLTAAKMFMNCDKEKAMWHTGAGDVLGAIEDEINKR
jgi:hypothetical protein